MHVTSDASVRIMVLCTGQAFHSRLELPGDQTGFEIGNGAAATKMSEEISPAEHGGNLRDSFFFHCGGGAAAIEGVIVGIDPHGQRVGETSDWMRGLEHLAGIERIKVGVVVV